MDRQRHRLAVVLNWFAPIWLVCWAIFVTFQSELASTAQGMTSKLAALLIPAALAYAVSWALDRYSPGDQDNRPSALRHMKSLWARTPAQGLEARKPQRRAGGASGGA